MKRFIDLAGGPDAPIVIIPTAGEATTIQLLVGTQAVARERRKNLTVIHTRDRKVAEAKRS